MKLDELLEDILDQFHHLFYEFLEEYVDWDFTGEKFQCLVQISIEKFEVETYLNLNPNLVFQLFPVIRHLKYQRRNLLPDMSLLLPLLITG